MEHGNGGNKGFARREAEEFKHGEVTQRIIDVFYHVYNTLGYGFLEKVYENAMVVELTGRGLQVRQQQPIRVYYSGQSVGEYFADLVVDDTVIVELKAAEQVAEEHEAQLINYLRATRLEVGLLLNFGPKPQVRRKVFDNERKELANPVAVSHGGS